LQKWRHFIVKFVKCWCSSYVKFCDAVHHSVVIIKICAWIYQLVDFF
jgi:hypothetical protein